MNKMLRPKESRSVVSARELILLAGLVIAGFAWYKEYERANWLNQQLESANHMFNGMLDTEAKLREHPETKSARLRFMDFGGPKPALQWSMEVKVLDDSPASADGATPPPPSAATEPAAAEPAGTK
jgi:hypothetical protein